MGSISNIGTKTPRAARDRPEQNLEAKFSRRNDTGDLPDGGRTAAAVANLACGVWPHAAAPCAALPRSIVRQPWRTSGRPPRNIVAQPCAKRRTAMAQQLRNAAGSSPGHRVETAPSLRPMCAASAQRGARLLATVENFFLLISKLKDLMQYGNNCIDQILTLALIPLLGNNGVGSGSRLPGQSGKQNCPGDDQYNM
ncbi:hypothetical protein F511_20796 [Dorcoceras hygrometricum]|uniref:Uncharacterized protein n=1 Tax=Dorcoceras hygrometricum TaxID=472368 RepID=A0A2Z7B813_9LAMI|nr:hypothetical protein F511_20796 [Dorcoceras hygrometricum]